MLTSGSHGSSFHHLFCFDSRSGDPDKCLPRHNHVGSGHELEENVQYLAATLGLGPLQEVKSPQSMSPNTASWLSPSRIVRIPLARLALWADWPNLTERPLFPYRGNAENPFRPSRKAM